MGGYISVLLLYRRDAARGHQQRLLKVKLDQLTADRKLFFLRDSNSGLMHEFSGPQPLHENPAPSKRGIYSWYKKPFF